MKLAVFGSLIVLLLTGCATTRFDGFCLAQALGQTSNGATLLKVQCATGEGEKE